MPKNISPEQEDAMATPQNSDDSQAQEQPEDAQDALDAMINGPQPQPSQEEVEEQEQESEVNQDEQEQEQPSSEAQEEFARFGSRVFKSKDDLMDYVKKVHGDNSRLVGDIRKLEQRLQELESAKQDPQETPQQLSESELAVEEAKKALQKTLAEMGYVTKSDIEEKLSPIIEERLEKQASELEKFIEEEANDFWDYEEQIRSLDGQINPLTGKAYTAQEAYKVVKYLADPESVAQTISKSKEKKIREAGKKQASMGTGKSVAKSSDNKKPVDPMDALLGLQI